MSYKAHFFILMLWFISLYGMEQPATHVQDQQIMPLRELCAQVIMQSLVNAGLNTALRLEMTLNKDIQGLIIEFLNKNHKVDLMSVLEFCTPLTGPTKYVRCIAWRPDGKYVLCIGDEDNAYLWDTADLSQVKPLRGHANGGEFAGWAPDGTKAYTTTYNHTINVWDMRNMQDIQPTILRGHTDFIKCVECMPRHERIISGSNDTTIRIWDSPNLLPVLRGHNDCVTSISCHPLMDYVVSTSNDGTVRLWNITDLAHISSMIILAHQPGEFGRNCMHKIKFNANGTAAIAGGLQLGIVLFDMRNLDLVTTTQIISQNSPSYPKALQWRPGKSTSFLSITYADKDTALVCNTRSVTSPAITKLGNTLCELSSSTWSPCGNFAATGTGTNDQNIRPVTLWQFINTTQPKSITLQRHTDSVVALAWQPSGKYLASGSLYDHQVILWDTTPCTNHSLSQVVFLIKIIHAGPSAIELLKQDVYASVLQSFSPLIQEKISAYLERKLKNTNASSFLKSLLQILPLIANKEAT